MRKNLRLDVENIDILLRQLHDFHQTLCQEWGNVASQWNNLKSTWFDRQFEQFEPKFEELSANYYEEIEQCEKYITFLSQIIKIDETKPLNMGELAQKIIGGVQITQAFASVLLPNCPVPTSPLEEPNSAYTQELNDNNCMTNFLHPNSMGIEEQFVEYYGQELEKRKSHQNEKIRENIDNIPSTHLPLKKPIDISPVSDFAKNLDYKTIYGSFESFEVKSQAKIEAVSADGSGIGYINVKKENDGRIFIQDINVANDYRRKGIATMLIYHLEEKFKQGTQLYFVANDAPKFWKEMGFKPINNNGKNEYSKTL